MNWTFKEGTLERRCRVWSTMLPYRLEETPSFVKAVTISLASPSSRIDSKLYAELYPFPCCQSFYNGRIRNQHMAALTAPWWSRITMPTPISLYRLSTATSQLILSCPGGGFCHWVLRVSGFTPIILGISMAIWKASWYSFAYWTKHLGGIICPPETTLFLRSHNLWTMMATNSKSAASSRLLRCSKMERNSPPGIALFWMLRLHSTQNAIEAGHPQIIGALNSAAVPQIGQGDRLVSFYFISYQLLLIIT